MSFEEELKIRGFLRVHKTHIINLRNIKSYKLHTDGGTIIMVDSTSITLAGSRKEEFINLLSQIIN